MSPRFACEQLTTLRHDPTASVGRGCVPGARRLYGSTYGSQEASMRDRLCCDAPGRCWLRT